MSERAALALIVLVLAGQFGIAQSARAMRQPLTAYADFCINPWPDVFPRLD